MMRRQRLVGLTLPSGGWAAWRLRLQLPLLPVEGLFDIRVAGWLAFWSGLKAAVHPQVLGRV